MKKKSVLLMGLELITIIEEKTTFQFLLIEMECFYIIPIKTQTQRY